MKRFIILLVVTILAIASSGCQGANRLPPNPSEKTKNFVPPVEPAATSAPTITKINTPTAVAPGDLMNITIEIDGQLMTLVNGVSEKEAAPGSAAKIITRFLGNQVSGNLPGDHKPGVVFLVTQDPGGSGTFFYVVAAIQNDSGGYTSTNAILLGDRIAPQNIKIQADKIIVNYSDRQQGEPMTAPPSVSMSKYLQLQQGRLVELPLK